MLKIWNWIKSWFVKKPEPPKLIDAFEAFLEKGKPSDMTVRETINRNRADMGYKLLSEADVVTARREYDSIPNIGIPFAMFLMATSMENDRLDGEKRTEPRVIEAPNASPFVDGPPVANLVVPVVEHKAPVIETKEYVYEAPQATSDGGGYESNVSTDSTNSE